MSEDPTPCKNALASKYYVTDTHATGEDERGGVPSASLFPAIARCAGRWNATQALPKEIQDVKDADGEEGTKRHSLIEQATDDNAQAVEAFDDNAQEQTVNRALTLLNEARRHAHLDDYEADRIVTEQRLWYVNRETGKALFSGKFDRLEIYGDVGILIDYKTMWNDHGTAASNEQLAAYAVLVADFYMLHTVIVALIQPNLPKAKQLTITVYEDSIIELARAQSETIVYDALAKDAQRTAGIKQCKYCPAKAAGVCDVAMQDALVTISEQSERSLMLPVTTEELDKIEIVEEIWQAYRKNRKAKAEAMLEENPDALPGYYLKNTGATMEVTDMRLARELLGNDMLDEDFNEAMSLSFSKLVKPYQKVVACKSQKEARALLEERLAPVLKKTEKKKSLARR